MPSIIPSETLLKTVVAAAQRAGNHALANHHRRHETILLADHDVKLVLDVECQKEAEAEILATYPDHAILGEEGQTSADSPYEWIIDPIDGTVNFHHGLPTWCCSIAVKVQGEVVAGCVYLPMLNENYTAWNGSNTALLNGEPISVSQVGKINEALCVAGLGKPSDGYDAPLQGLNRVVKAARHTRLHGVAAIDLVWVAAGRIDAYLDGGIYPWDYAAGALIIEQAGGKVTYGKDFGDLSCQVFATNGLLHEEGLAVYHGT